MTRGRISAFLRAAPRLAEWPFAYLYDMRRIYRVLPASLLGRFWIIVVLSILRAIVESSFIFVIALFTQSVSSPQSLRAGWIYRTATAHLPDALVSHLNADRSLILVMCLLVILFVILKNLIVFLASSSASVFSEMVGLHIGQETYSRYLSQSYLWHMTDQSKDMLNRIDRRGQLVQLTTSIIQMFSNLFCAAVMFAVLFAASPRLTMAIVAIFAVVSACTYLLLRRKIDRAGAEISRIATEQNWAMRLVARGIREIIIYRKQEVFLETLASGTRAAIRPKTFLAISGGVPGWFLEVSGFCVIFGAMTFLVAGGAPLPEVVASMSLLLLAAWRILPMVSRSMGLAVRIRSIRPRALQCLELLESLPGSTPGPAREAEREFSFAHSIELANVSFRYPKGKEDCLTSLSLSLRKGEQLGLVGKSGAGKSTLGLILAGLFPPLAGTMLADGAAIGPERIEAYRRRVGYVPQTPLLLPGSIADNVALSQWGESCDEAKLRAACSLAAMDFVQIGKKSLRFHIGDGGDGLSGGEAQRVSIARALYTDPDIVIFDEATSSLDRASEKAIIQAMQSLRGRATTVIIAHRLATVAHCDRVVWLENGMIRAAGPPAEVLPKYDPGYKA